MTHRLWKIAIVAATLASGATVPVAFAQESPESAVQVPGSTVQVPESFVQVYVTLPLPPPRPTVLPGAASPASAAKPVNAARPQRFVTRPTPVRPKVAVRQRIKIAKRPAVVRAAKIVRGPRYAEAAITPVQTRCAGFCGRYVFFGGN